MHPHFSIVTSDERKNIFVIGDLHGAIETFNKLLTLLTPTDTLIIAGDLIDRGQNSLDEPASALVLDKILELNNAPEGTSPQIYAIQGNHEQYFLSTLKMLRQDSLGIDEKIWLLHRFIRNGGGWIFRHPNEESNKSLQDYCHYCVCNFKLDEAWPIIENYLRQILDVPNLFEDFIVPNIFQYEKYIASLPYILKIQDDTYPAWVAHADLLLSDDDLNNRIENKTPLTDLEIHHLTEARPEQFLPAGIRNKTSNIVYCGHNIITDEGQDLVHPVRPETNHFNLDGAAFSTNGLLVVNHTKRQVFVVGDKVSATDEAFLQSAKTTIEESLSHALVTPKKSSLIASKQSMFSEKKVRKKRPLEETPNLNDMADSKRPNTNT